MRDPERIAETLATIHRIWYTYPDLRLGQLILNAIPPDNKTDLYYIEDDVLLKYIEDLYEKRLGVSKSQ